MKAYSMGIRERVIKFIQNGGSKVEAMRRFSMARSSVYRYLEASQKGTLEPKKSWGHWRKLDPKSLQEYIEKFPDATLKQMQKVFKVSHNTLWVRLNKLGITLKKSHHLPRAQRGATLAVCSRTSKTQPSQRLLPRRMRH